MEWRHSKQGTMDGKKVVDEIATRKNTSARTPRTTISKHRKTKTKHKENIKTAGRQHNVCLHQIPKRAPSLLHSSWRRRRILIWWEYSFFLLLLLLLQRDTERLCKRFLSELLLSSSWRRRRKILIWWHYSFFLSFCSSAGRQKEESANLVLFGSSRGVSCRGWIEWLIEQRLTKEKEREREECKQGS